MILLRLTCAGFGMEINIQNNLHRSPVHIHKLNISGQGSFGNIYFSKIFDRYTVIKCIPFDKNNF